MNWHSMIIIIMPFKLLDYLLIIWYSLIRWLFIDYVYDQMILIINRYGSDIQTSAIAVDRIYCIELTIITIQQINSIIAQQTSRTITQ